MNQITVQAVSGKQKHKTKRKLFIVGHPRLKRDV